MGKTGCSLLLRRGRWEEEKGKIGGGLKGWEGEGSKGKEKVQPSFNNEFKKQITFNFQVNVVLKREQRSGPQ